jgi:hypothetical protein
MLGVIRGGNEVSAGRVGELAEVGEDIRTGDEDYHKELLDETEERPGLGYEE